LGDMIIRLSDAGEGGDVVLELAAEVKSARYCGLTESKWEPCAIAGNRIILCLRKDGITSIRVTLCC